MSTLRIIPLCAVLLLFSACTMPASQPTPVLDVSDASRSTVTQTVYSGALTLGNPDAPISFVLFTHHSCTYCKTFDRAFTDRLLTEFVETNLIRLIIVPVPLQKYPESARQERLLACAIQQEKGLPMHRSLFDGEPTEEQLMDIGIDPALLSTCTETGTLITPTPSNVSLVPSYTINGTLYKGLPEWAELRGQIKEALPR